MRGRIFRTCSDPVLLFWYQDFSGAGGQNQEEVLIRRIPGRSAVTMPIVLLVFSSGKVVIEKEREKEKKKPRRRHSYK
jgi:hypothetical protein